MGCDFPLKAYRPPPERGGRMVFNPKHALNPNNPIDVPCGRCRGCILTKARDWAVRCCHEVQMHDASCFITLTYDDKHLPPDFSVHKRVWQLFMMRLRERIQPKRVRFFACGEYGGESLRPHYHALIFGYDFPDKQRITSLNNKRHPLYKSDELSTLWTYGFSSIGAATFNSAGYTARYTLKKIGDATRHASPAAGSPRAASEASEPEGTGRYQVIHPITRRLVTQQPEFLLMSRRPGLGRSWFDKYRDDAFPSDFIVIDGTKHPVPAYYSKLIEEAELKKLKRARARARLDLKKKGELTDARRYVKATVRDSRISKLKREL